MGDHLSRIKQWGLSAIMTANGFFGAPAIAGMKPASPVAASPVDEVSTHVGIIQAYNRRSPQVTLKQCQTANAALVSQFRKAASAVGENRPNSGYRFEALNAGIELASQSAIGAGGTLRNTLNNVFCVPGVQVSQQLTPEDLALRSSIKIRDQVVTRSIKTIQAYNDRSNGVTLPQCEAANTVLTSETSSILELPRNKVGLLRVNGFYHFGRELFLLSKRASAVGATRDDLRKNNFCVKNPKLDFSVTIDDVPIMTRPTEIRINGVVLGDYPMDSNVREKVMAYADAVAKDTKAIIAYNAAEPITREVCQISAENLWSGARYAHNLLERRVAGSDILVAIIDKGRDIAALSARITGKSGGQNSTDVCVGPSQPGQARSVLPKVQSKPQLR